MAETMKTLVELQLNEGPAESYLEQADLADQSTRTARFGWEADERSIRITLPGWLTGAKRRELRAKVDAFFAAAVENVRRLQAAEGVTR